ncbi:hypothetical protein ACFROC_30300 [Nocardia tengchongensis]|uniref:hypothetical protein n=1 Tax=Nocardia tengchongensis TaxID=2055889 RepID=UPI0036BE194F
MTATSAARPFRQTAGLIGVWPDARGSRSVRGSSGRSTPARSAYCRIGSGAGCRWLVVDVEVRDE